MNELDETLPNPVSNIQTMGHKHFRDCANYEAPQDKTEIGGDKHKDTAILAQAISDRTTCCLRALWQVFLFLVLFVAPFVRRCVMPRRGWQQMDVPTGWVRVIRGPRPPSEKWPAARPVSVGRWRSGQQSKPSPPKSASRPQEFEPSRTPEVAVADAIGEVKKLEAAIAALGADSVHARGLQEALRIARNESRLPSVSERVESCKKFLERARQRVSRAQDVIDKATAQKAVHEAEVAEGERRLAQLQAEASQPVGEVLPQVSVLQGQIDALIRERDAGRAETAEGRSKWMGTGPPLCRSNSTHAHRSSGVGQVVKRQELRSEECNRVREPRTRQSDWCLIGQGAGQVAKVGRSSVVEGQSRSAMMSDLIQEQSKRRCLSSGAALTLQS